MLGPVLFQKLIYNVYSVKNIIIRIYSLFLPLHVVAFQWIFLGIYQQEAYMVKVGLAQRLSIDLLVLLALQKFPSRLMSAIAAEAC